MRFFKTVAAGVASVATAALSSSIFLKSAAPDGIKEHSSSSASSSFSSLQGFHIDQILHKDIHAKKITLLGRFKAKNENDRAIVTLERSPLKEDHIEDVMDTMFLSMQFHNDIYSSYLGYSPLPTCNEFKIDVVYPATNHDVAKFSPKKKALFVETADQYRKVTKKVVDASPESRIQWVYNILSKKSEAERLIYEDPDAESGFMLHPDMRWDGDDANTKLYCIALCHKKGIRTLRDLNGKHLPMLRNIQKAGTEAIKNKYGVDGSALRIFVHYIPSYYHFHVHFEHVNRPANATFATTRAHLLSDVIQNLETDPKYYEKRTISFELDTDHPIAKEFKK